MEWQETIAKTIITLFTGGGAWWIYKTGIRPLFKGFRQYSKLPQEIMHIANDVQVMMQKQDAMMLLSTVAMFECDPDGYVIGVNKKWCEITGLLPSEALGTGWYRIFLDQDEDKVRMAWERTIKSKSQFDEKLQIKNAATSSIHEIHISAIICVNRDKEIVRIFGTFALI